VGADWCSIAALLEVVRVERIPADRAIVKRFVDHLRDEGRSGLNVDCWPEDENPGQSEIEAIAGDLAIEHTSIDTLPHQRTIGDHFEEALAILEQLPVSARLAINVPYELVEVGTDWNAFRLALAHWILNIAPGLPDGVHEMELPGTGLRCTADKNSDWQHRVVLSRPAPNDDTLPARVAVQIRRKAKKLARYKAKGYTTVLLLETKDSSLMNQHKMLDAAREGLGGAMIPGVDQIWYVEADGYVTIDLTSALLNGDDVLE
jgi:hypothetical protein